MGVISILLPDLRGGGVERVRIALAHEFARVGHQPEFVLMQSRGELLTEAQAAFPVGDLGCDQARQLPGVLTRYLRARRPDAVLAAMWPLTVMAPLARVLSRHDCRLAISEHNRLSVQYRGWGRAHRIGLRASTAAAYRVADACIGVSSGVADDMAELSGIDRRHFTVIHNPAPRRQEPAQRDIGRADKLWQGAAGGRVLAVGRFKKQKNHALLLRAFAQLDRSDVSLMFLGDGDLEAPLRELAAELGLGQRVTFAGFHSDPTAFYHTADLFVLSSDYEGFGNVIVEAMACGTPVVSTDCPSGPAEILADGKFGTLVPVRDAPALARAMEDALSRPHDPECLRARAREFAPGKAARAYLELLFPGA